MADQRLTDKTALTVVAQDDLVHVVDVSDTTANAEGTSKKVTIANLKTAVAGAGSGVQSVTGDIVDNTDPLNPVVNSSIKKVKITLTAAEFIAIDTTPIEVILAPGVGKALDIISIFGKLNFNTLAFDVFQLGIKHNSSSAFFAILGRLNETSTVLIKGAVSNGLCMVENEALQIAAAGSAPTVGNSTIDIYINYEIITL